MSTNPDERFGLGRWHCDDFINHGGAVDCLRQFLAIARASAVDQIGKHRPPLFATTCADVTARDFLGHGPNGPIMRDRVIPKGTRVRIVMASRFGDVGITDNLDADHGYVARVFLPELHEFTEKGR